MSNDKKQFKEEDLSGISDMLEGKHHVIPIVANEDDEAGENADVPETLPILTLRSSVLFPGSITPITVGRQRVIHRAGFSKSFLRRAELFSRRRRLVFGRLCAIWWILLPHSHLLFRLFMLF